jgi:hypothetical protein
VCVAQKEGFLEELGSRKWQIVGPEARYAGWVQIRLITKDHDGPNFAKEFAGSLGTFSTANQWSVDNLTKQL